MEKKTILIVALIIGALVIIGGVWWYQNNQPSKYDDFATCIKESGAKFYGAFWCPHCQDQKSLFGRAAKNLPYVECSTPDTNGQLPVCNNEKIESYPTWKFSDGTVNEGELSLQKLAEATGCQLPQ